MSSYGSEHERVVLTDHERRVLEDIETHLTIADAGAATEDERRGDTPSPVAGSVAMAGSALACAGLLTANWALLLVGLTAAACVAVRCLSNLPGRGDSPT